MLSKILIRSGLSRLLWIKDAASHRLDGCVLELYGLLVACEAKHSLCGSDVSAIASCLLPTTLHQLSKSIAISLACQSACLYDASPLLDPLGRRSPSGTDTQRMAGCSLLNHTSRNQPRRRTTPVQCMYSSQSLKPSSGTNADVWTRGVCPFYSDCSVLGFVYGLAGTRELSDINHA